MQHQVEALTRADTIQASVTLLHTVNSSPWPTTCQQLHVLQSDSYEVLTCPANTSINSMSISVQQHKATGFNVTPNIVLSYLITTCYYVLSVVGLLF